MKISQINFPDFSGVRCLMMPFIQGDRSSLPNHIKNSYGAIVEGLAIERGEIGFLTIDESRAIKGSPHRGERAKFSRALHTEAGRRPDKIYAWGSGGCWGRSHRVELDRDVKVLLANSVDNSCALWDCEHEDTSIDGDIGDKSDIYPYSSAVFMGAGEVHQIGILTPHESLPVKESTNRQFLRIVSKGVYGREPYFTKNPILNH